MRLLLLLSSIAAHGFVYAQEPFSVSSHDDFTIRGEIYAGQGEASTVLLLHQCDKDRQSLDTLAHSLHQAGLAVLNLDFRGFGESTSAQYDGDTGHRAVLFPHFARDLEAVLSEMDARGLTENGLGVVGVDCGAAMALLASLVHAKITAVTLISPTLEEPWISDSVWTAAKDNHKTAYLLVNSIADQIGAGGASRLFNETPNYLNKIIWYKGRSRGTALFDLDPSLVYEISAWMAERLGMVPSSPPGYTKPVSTQQATAEDD